MELLSVAKELITTVQQAIGTSWWLEITTTRPHCTYYFGPFHESSEAEAAAPGYVQDLHNEGAEGIQINLKRCRNPGEKTICYDD